MKAIKLHTDGQIEIIENDDKFVGYATLSDGVGGFIEAVTLGHNLTLWVNEEGKLNNLPYNSNATRLFKSLFGAVDVIVGNAILTGGVDEDGETLGLTDEQVLRYEFSL